MQDEIVLVKQGFESSLRESQALISCFRHDFSTEMAVAICQADVPSSFGQLSNSYYRALLSLPRSQLLLGELAMLPFTLVISF